MKKLLSALLALTLVFSLSVMAFAEDAPAEAAAAETTTVCATCPDPVDTLDELFDLIQSDKFKADLKEATDKLQKLGKTLEELLKDTEKIAPAVDGLLEKIAEETDIDVAELKTKLGETEIFNWFAKLYMPAIPTTEAPVVTTTVKTTTAVPKTGSAAGGIAIFATLSIAAAAAFVCTKKK